MVHATQLQAVHGDLSSLEHQCRLELEQSIQSLREIALLIEKTNSEVEKLTAREMQIANRIREMESHLSNFSREDIRDLYASANDAQMRLVMMRSQADQLQTRQLDIRAHQEKLRLLIDLLAAQSFDPRQATALLPQQPRMTMALGTDNLTPGQAMINIIEAQEDERLRLSRQINDGPTQAFANLILRAEVCERLLDRDVEAARAELSGLRTAIHNSLQEARRLVYDLRPLAIGENGLVATLERYLAEVSALRNLPCTFNGPKGHLGLGEPMQVALFRMVQGCLAALLADGSADAIHVNLECADGIATLQVEGASVDTEAELIGEKLDDPEMVNRILSLNAVMQADPLDNYGYAILIQVPVPIEMAA